MLLYRPNSDGAIAPTVYNFDGRYLSRRLKKLDIAKRALLARDLERGVVHLKNLTRAQAVAIARVPSSYVGTVQHASDEDLGRLACGSLTMSALHHRRRPVTDADVERIVKKIGVSRVFAVIDRLTAPVLQTAE